MNIRTRLSSKGFGAVEVILFATAVVCMAAVAWYVWQAQSITTVQSQQSQQSQHETAPAAAYPPAGWKEYKNDQVGVSFIFPDTWKLTGEENLAANEGFDIKVASPESREDDSSGINMLIEGSIFYLSVDVLDASYTDYYSTVQEYLAYLENGGFYNQNMKLEEIAGKQAVTSDCGHYGDFYCATFIENGYIFNFNYRYPSTEGKGRVNKDQNMSEFKVLLDSIKFAKD